MSGIHELSGGNNQHGQRSRRSPPEAFLNTIEAQRYAFLAEMFRECDRPVLAQMCDNWAREHRLTVVKLGEMEKRLSKLDARLREIGGVE